MHTLDLKIFICSYYSILYSFIRCADVDVSPSSRNYGRVIEKILEFGKELSSMGQQLEKENLMTEEERQMLEVLQGIQLKDIGTKILLTFQDAFSLIAYSNPWSSPLGWLLCPSRRENVSTTLNSAILGRFKSSQGLTRS